MSKIDSWRKNELEMLMICCEKALSNMEGGIVTHRGTAEENKMSYKKALKRIKEFSNMYAMNGAYSFGICGECSKFTTAHLSPSTAGTESGFGRCGNKGGKDVHRYHSCNNHSVKGGGWGLDYGREDRPD